MNVKRTKHAERSEATRAALVAAARPLFAERGYAGVGTEEIVRARGRHARRALPPVRRQARALRRRLRAGRGATSTQRTAGPRSPSGAGDPLAVLRVGAAGWLEACTRARGPAHRAARRPGGPRLGSAGARSACATASASSRTSCRRRSTPAASQPQPVAAARPRADRGARRGRPLRRDAPRTRTPRAPRSAPCSTAYSGRSPDAGRRSGGPSRRTPSSSGMRGQAVAQPRAVGRPQVEVELEQRDEHEAARCVACAWGSVRRSEA